MVLNSFICLPAFLQSGHEFQRNIPQAKQIPDPAWFHGDNLKPASCRPGYGLFGLDHAFEDQLIPGVVWYPNVVVVIASVPLVFFSIFEPPI